ncbi:MAG TPA: helix-turn-helix transcriptional regulator [Acidimicrobiales bacterium]|nr:helix-turn-helix transcriptional regulator [Acidimicrobiales bacterium]
MKTRDTDLLVALRAGKKVSIRKAALDLAISKSHLADIEAGNRQPSYDVGLRIATYYGVSLGALFEELPLEFGAPA